MHDQEVSDSGPAPDRQCLLNAPATLRPAQLAAIPLRMEEDKKVQIAKDDKAPAEEEDRQTQRKLHIMLDYVSPHLTEEREG